MSKQRNRVSGTDSITGALCRLAIPIMLSQLLQISHQFICLFWVGRLGADAVAAISVGYPLIFTLAAMAVGFAIAGSILLAQFAGAGDSAAINRAAGQTLFATTSIALLFGLAGYLGAPTILRTFDLGGAAYTDACRYLRLSFLTTPILFFNVTFQFLVRAVGEVRVPLYVMTAGIALNLMLDPLLILGYGALPGFGVTGAALATLLAQGTAAVIGFQLLRSGRHGIAVGAEHLLPRSWLIKRLLVLGVPTGFELLIQAAGIGLLTALAARHGVVAVAALGIGYRVMNFAFVPAVALASATSVLIGHAIGGGRPEQVERIARHSVLITFLLMLTASAIVYGGADFIARALVPHDTALQQLAPSALRGITTSFACMGVHGAFAGALRGTGDTLAPMMLAVIRTFALQLPLAWLLSTSGGLGVDGIWLSFLIANLVSALVAWGGFWRRHRFGANGQFDGRTPAVAQPVDG